MSDSPSSILSDLPYLTPDVAPIAGAIKRRYEDFVVEEIPAYEPCGKGDHCFIRIEKTGLATMRAINDIAKALGRNPRDIGTAGLKDARGVTIQTLSLEHADPAEIRDIEIPRIRILNVTRHANKLKVGHLRGNRFRIRLRDVDLSRMDDIRAVCATLEARGVPNYFGQQRFGSRGDSGEIGKAILHQDYKTAVDLMLGRPGPADSGPVLEARRLYEQGEFAQAAKTWPYGMRDCIQACRTLDKTHGNHKRVVMAMNPRLKKLFVNAFQSQLFNEVLGRRINEIDRVRKGDLACKHENGAVFLVEDADEENPRATAFEISPTGPIFGFKMRNAEGDIAQLEQSVCDRHVENSDVFAKLKGMRLFGTRRPLRFQPDDLSVEPGEDEFGVFVEIRVALAAGCYATALLREICKDRLEEGLDEDRVD